MSNPAVCFLAATEFRGVPFCIEDNLGESIHIHYGMVRITLSINDFFLFADSIRIAAEQLFELNGLIWDDFDVDSLKYEWVDYYTKIKNKKCRTVRLDSLFMKESYVKKRSIKRIIPLQESGYIRLLQGDCADIDYYSQQGKYEPSRKEKVEAIGKLIDNTGYPFGQKRILINQEGYILDGIKRASYLYYKFGGKKEIIVDVIDLPELDSVDVRKSKAEKEIAIWMSVHENQCREQNIKKCHFDQFQITMEDVIEKLKKSDVRFFVVNKEKMIEHQDLVSNIIVVEEQKFDTVQEMFNDARAVIHPYEGYGFLYGLKKPLAVKTTNSTVLVCDKPFCKSRFEKELLPMDQFVVNLCWKHIIWNDALGCCQLDSKMLAFWTILDSILELDKFSASDINFIEKNREILEEHEYISAFEKEFFRFTPNLINYLLTGQYNEVLRMYERFSDY